MKALLKVLGVVVISFFILVITTSAVLFIKKVWFGKSKSADHVAVLDLTGVIYGSTSLVRKIEKHLENPSVKALVVRINSPGGVVAPSQEIYEAFKRADAKIPVVMTMGSLAASGGYYIALAGRKIYANPGTLTGSIGVIMEFVNTEKLYEWAKIQRFTLTAGKMKDAGSPFKPMKPEEKAIFQAMLTDIHSQFKGAVKERRKLTDEQIEATTDGRVFTGSQALEAKLVDALGGYEDALKEAKALAKLPETATVEYPEQDSGMLRKILFGDSDEAEESWKGVLTFLGQNPLPGLSPGWRVMMLSPLR